MVSLVYEEENSFWWHLLEVYALESEVWEQLPHLSKHRDTSRAVLFLIKMAQNRICLLSFPAGESPSHAEDRVSLPAPVLTSTAEMPGHARQEEWDLCCGTVFWAQQNDFYSTSVRDEPSSNSQISHSSDTMIRVPLSRSLKTAQFQRFQSGNLPVWLLQETSL